MTWNIHHSVVTCSTNLDARCGAAGDVFTAEFQTAGRGRLDHTWQSPRGMNLMLSAVIDVAGLAPSHVCTLPLVAGLSVAQALSRWTMPHVPMIKWPNDVLVASRKITGILCERVEDRVIVGIGVNVGQESFPLELREKATSLRLLLREASVVPCVTAVRDAVLARLAANAATWRTGGLEALYAELVPRDVLRGRLVRVFQTESDVQPVEGVADGIQRDGTLSVAGVRVYAGEAHVIWKEHA